MMRGVVASVAALTLGSCLTQRGGTAPERAAPHEPAPSVAHACTYELAAAPTTLAPSLLYPSKPAAAAAGGKVLAVYQTPGSRGGLRARLVDPTRPAGEEILVSPAIGGRGSPAAIPHDSRFLVTWQVEDPPRNQGRWVGADGALGPIVDLPFDDPAIHLVAHGSGFSAAYVHDHDRGSTLYRVLLDAELRPLGPALPVDDAQEMEGAWLAQLALANGEIWQLVAASGRKRTSKQIHLVRLDASGTVIGTVDELTSTRGDAVQPGLVEVAGGVLVAWFEMPESGPSGTWWTRKLDPAGKPLGPALKVGDAATRRQRLQLVLDAGEPLLLTQRSRNIRLDASGAPKAEATATPPSGDHATWLPTAPSPSLVWEDFLGDHERSLLFAPLRCADK